MVARKTVCLKRLGGDRAGELRIGRFFANERVTKAQTIADWGHHTRAACSGRHVLAIDHTTELKFATTREPRRGLGPVKKGKAYGLLVHSMIAVDAASGACLGLVGGEIWTRPGVNPIPHGKRPPQARESMRWLNTAAQAKQVLAAATSITVADDRESDFYAKWATVPQPGVPMLTRCMNDRRLATGEMLFARMAGFRVAGQRKIALAAHEPGKRKRTAIVRLRYGTAAIRRPDDADRNLPAVVHVHCIDVAEINPPADAEPLHWRLLTTHAIGNARAAWEVVGW